MRAASPEIKALHLQALIQRYHLDILAVNETWLTDGNEERLVINGYQLSCANRKRLNDEGNVMKGGGVAIYVKEGIEIDEHETRDHATDTPFEYLKIRITQPLELYVICAYIKPKKSIWNTKKFFSYCINNRIHDNPFVAIGDFNVAANKYRSDIRTIEQNFHVTQLIHSRTFKSNENILDHIYVPETINIIDSGVREVDDNLSHHNLTYCKMRPTLPND